MTRRVFAFELRMWHRVGLALLAAALHLGGALLAWPLVFLALVPLGLATTAAPPLRAAALGCLTGAATTLVGFAWLPAMLRGFTGLPSFACTAAWVGLSIFQGGRWALFAWLYARVTSRGWPAAAALIAAHSAAELLFPLPFPWHLGSALYEVLVLAQVADLGGPLAVSAIALFGNALVVTLLSSRFGHREPHWRKWAAACAASLAVAVAYGLVRIRQVEAALTNAERFAVGVVHTNLTPLTKRSKGALRARMEASRELLRSHPIDLLVWSESAAPAITQGSYAREGLERLITRRLSVPTLFGGFVDLPGADGVGARQYNSVFLSNARGEICEGCRYDKQVLLPFGEFLPGAEWFPSLRARFDNTGRLSAGPRRSALTLGDHALAVTICYEDLHASYVNRLMADSRAGLLVNVTDDAWFRGSRATVWHFALARARAIEQRRFMVRAANGGVSAVVDPLGRVMARGVPGEATTLSARVAWIEGRTVFSYLGDAPWWLLGLAVCVPAIAPRGRRRWWRRG